MENKRNKTSIQFYELLNDNVIYTNSNNISVLFYSYINYLIRTNFFIKNGTGKDAIYKLNQN